MKKQIGKKGLALIMKAGYNKYAVRFAIEDYTPTPEEHRPAGKEYVKYASIEFTHRPTLQEIREAIEAAHNADINEAIINGLTFNGKFVHLSIENQTNFAAMLSAGQYPATVKIGAEYETFETLSDFMAFYRTCRAHIEATLASGRAIKEAYDWSTYAAALENV